MPSFTADSLPNLQGKVYLVTGGNNGIGRSTVAGLANKGARVYMGARSEKKAQAAIAELREQMPTADIRFLEMDLLRFSSVLAAAKKILAEETQLHGLVNNAGVMGTAFSMTEDGFEGQFQTNYLSHWLLTYHLLPLLQRTATAADQPGSARIVNVSSTGHVHFAPHDGICFADTALPSESGRTRYGQSKLANVLHARQLNVLYGPDAHQKAEIWSASLHPGVVKTGLLVDAESFGPALLRRAITTCGSYVGLLVSEATGALSSLWAVASPDFPRAQSGGYVVPYARMGAASALGQDAGLAAKLWTWTEDRLGSKGWLE